MDIYCTSICYKGINILPHTMAGHWLYWNTAYPAFYHLFYSTIWLWDYITTKKWTVLSETGIVWKQVISQFLQAFDGMLMHTYSLYSLCSGFLSITISPGQNQTIPRSSSQRPSQRAAEEKEESGASKCQDNVPSRGEDTVIHVVTLIINYSVGAGFL